VLNAWAVAALPIVHNHHVVPQIRAGTLPQVSSPHLQVGGMRKLGYIEGKNDEYECRCAEGRAAERAGPITAELIANGAM